MNLGSLTYPEAQKLLKAGAIGLWPIGSTEAHGPHLPLDTDVVISHETCRRAQAPLAELGIKSLILPPLSYTLTDCAAPFAGTLSLPKEVVQPYVAAVLRSAAQQGFRMVCLVNAHLEPAHRYLLRDAVNEVRGEGIKAALADPADRRFADRLTEEFQSGACHAGQYETSLVMAAGREVGAAYQELPANDVDILERIRGGARDFQEMGADDAYFGTPALATTEEGNTSYDELVKMVIEVVQENLS